MTDIACTDATVARMSDLRVLFFGDSFVVGVGDPTGLGWVGRVVAASHAAGRPLTAYNLGVRRDTSADVAARWRDETRSRMRDAEATFGVVFALGTNDATDENGRLRVDPEQAIDNLARMIDAARDDRLDVFVVGPPPAGEAAQDERVRALSARFAQAAGERGVRFVDTVSALAASPAWTREAALTDAAHPAAHGYAELADLVLAAGWLEWLRGLA
jgi:lysophospholipase L1-like esterase